MKHHPNPYDEEYEVPVKQDATMDANAIHLSFPDPLDDCDRRDQTDAGRLRRAEYAAERSGYTSLAILYRNSAWIAERGHSWLGYMHAQAHGMLDGRTDDVQARESRLKQYHRVCIEHRLPLHPNGTCPRCKDAQGRPFVLDMQSYFLEEISVEVKR